MGQVDALVSIGLPVRNGADRIGDVVLSVLAQDHARLELVICDNASTDGTEEQCRAFAASDKRVRYHRQPENVGLLNNFMRAMREARGEYFRWIGDDDWLAPNYVSRALAAFTDAPRAVLVTTQLAYQLPEGGTTTWPYPGTDLASDDPVVRLTEMLRLLNEERLLVDPLYSLMRREAVEAIPRRNMLREDEVFAAKLALTGPWSHVPEVLAGRAWSPDRLTVVARKLGVPPWQAHMANTLQCREILRWVDSCGLDADQRRRVRAAVAEMFLRRQARTATRRGRRLVRMAGGLAGVSR